jgi:multicomponent Na+:H+ antiporter subunit A
MGGGLLIAVLTAILPILTGNALLEHAAFEVEIAILGTVKATSALPFDIGVYLVVLGLILMMFEAFGDDEALDEVVGFSVRGDALEADSVLGDVFELERINELQLRRRQRDRL